jgi:acyl-CoA thioesterase FadM
MRWFRLILVFVSARFRQKLTITEASEISFTVWLTDIDVSIMNHAALLTVMETGRIDLMIRTGFFKMASKYKWYFPLSSISVQFFRSLKVFQRAVLVTKVLHVDPTWIFIEQKVLRGDKTIAVAIVKSTIRKGREQLNALEILKQLNIGEAPTQTQEFIESIENSNRTVKDKLIS